MLRVGLDDKVAIVTGSGRGIGRSIALSFAADGAKVVINDIEEEPARRVLEEITSFGREASVVVADVSRRNDVETMIKMTLEKYGKIDILVNNAGIVGPTVRIQDLTEEDWDRIMDVDLKGTFLCCRAVIPQMINQQKGRIVSVSSIAGKEGNANMVAYCAAKAGIIGFTKALSEEVTRYGIRVNCVCPALIETDLVKEMNEEQALYLRSKIPVGRLGKPDEVASLVKFLVSDVADFISGQAYNISGGRGSY